MPDDEPVDAATLARMPRAAQWGILLGLSALLSIAFELVHLPAALLIGPMIAGVIAGTKGATVRVWKPAYAAAQALIGVLVAAAISLTTLASFAADWPLVLVAVVATIGASSFLGWLISQWKILPGTTAVWGSAPGAATAMVLMAEAFGADARLVAFMQYLRVIMVSIAAALVARFWVDTSDVTVPQVLWFPPIDASALAATVAVAIFGGVGGRLLKLPSPFFLGTFLLAAALHLGFGVDFQLPQWLLAASYALIGWSIGLNFTRAILVHATMALPQVLGSIAVLIAFCGMLALALSQVLGIDPLTAYLATSPGGMDSVAVIAAAAHNVDIAFVMALQLARFLVVLLFGPAISRVIARLVKE